MHKISDDDLKYIFIHELSHYKRKDIFINWIAVTLQVIHWFNPIIWFSFKKMREDCEVACDAYALAHLDEVEYERYGLSIINLLSLTKSGWIPSTTSFLGNNNKNQIVRRVKLIKLFNKKANTIRKVIPLVIVLCLAIMGLTNPNLNQRVFPGKGSDNTNLANIVLNYVKFKETCVVFSPDLIDSDNVSGSEIQQMINNNLSELNKFTKENSDLYNKLNNTIQEAFKSQQKKSIRTFSGSVTNFIVNSTKIKNNAAELKITYTAHATYGQWQSGKWVKASPSNGIIEQIEFQKDSSGKWYITSDDWKFAPGTEP